MYFQRELFHKYYRKLYPDVYKRQQKDRETGMLKDVLIYNFSDGFENAHIIWASEGKMEMTARCV